MNTCRDCETLLAAEAVKYSTRHYLCPECAIERGIEFLKTLKTWQLECLPIGPLRKAGLLEDVAEEVKQRQGEYSPLQARSGLLRRAFAHSLNAFPAPAEFTADADEAFSGRGRS